MEIIRQVSTEVKKRLGEVRRGKRKWAEGIRVESERKSEVGGVKAGVEFEEQR